MGSWPKVWPHSWPNSLGFKISVGSKFSRFQNFWCGFQISVWPGGLTGQRSSFPFNHFTWVHLQLKHLGVPIASPFKSRVHSGLDYHGPPPQPPMVGSAYATFGCAELPLCNFKLHSCLTCQVLVTLGQPWFTRPWGHLGVRTPLGGSLGSTTFFRSKGNLMWREKPFDNPSGQNLIGWLL